MKIEGCLEKSVAVKEIIFKKINCSKLVLIAFLKLPLFKPLVPNNYLEFVTELSDTYRKNFMKSELFSVVIRYIYSFFFKLV